ncbi:hypothetical protein HK096_001989, partial [Nowakowskiella sp. JEL0078]
TYRLCYLYCRATKAVSVCPPAYYAHLVAARARFHFQGDQWNDNESDPQSGTGMKILGEIVSEDLNEHVFDVSARKDAVGGMAGASQLEISASYGSVKPELQRVMYFM